MLVLAFCNFIFVCNTIAHIDFYVVVRASACLLRALHAYFTCAVFSAPHAAMAPVTKLWLQLQPNRIITQTHTQNQICVRATLFFIALATCKITANKWHINNLLRKGVTWLAAACTYTRTQNVLTTHTRAHKLCVNAFPTRAAMPRRSNAALHHSTRHS